MVFFSLSFAFLINYVKHFIVDCHEFTSTITHFLRSLSRRFFFFFCVYRLFFHSAHSQLFLYYCQKKMDDFKTGKKTEAIVSRRAMVVSRQLCPDLIGNSRCVAFCRNKSRNLFKKNGYCLNCKGLRDRNSFVSSVFWCCCCCFSLSQN